MQQIMDAIRNHISTVQELLKLEVTNIHNIANKMINAVQAGKKIFWMGNGGSAADAQHLAAELIGRFMLERRSIPSIALTTDSSILTCLSNDYDYSIIFARQLEALCSNGDVVIGISTSGNSANVLKGMAVARKMGAYTVGMTGKHGNKLATVVDDVLMVPASNTARIQECHILVGHILCDLIEQAVAMPTCQVMEPATACQQ